MHQVPYIGPYKDLKGMSFKVHGITLSYNFRASLTAYYSIGFHRSGYISPASYIAHSDIAHSDIAHSDIAHSDITHSDIASFAGSITTLTTEVRFSTSYISEIYCCKKCLV